MTCRMIAAAALAGSTMFSSQAGAVEIEYWQYVYDTRVKAMDQLIASFQEANPDITVKQVTFPYADYQTRIVAANMAGQAPDVMQLFYGWADKFIEGGLIQPLPEEAFPTAEIEAEFFPIVSAMQRDGKYYGLPTAVRSLALFYNKKLLDEAGVAPPTNLDELVAVAKATAKADAGGNLETVGITMDPAGQDHHWWREVLDRQMGGAPYNEDYTQVTYADEAGANALGFYLGLARDEATVEHLDLAGRQGRQA